MKAAHRILVLVAAAFAATGWASDFSAWGKKAEIAFTGYTGSETLTNFPALVVLGADTISGFDYAECLAGGADLRFSDSTGMVELPYEIEQWNPAGRSLVWVRVPELAGADTSIWAYWGNAGASSPAYATNGAVWAEGYVGVWHLEQPNAPDSTSFANHGTANANVDVVGKIGTGQSFNGSSSRIACGTGASLNLPSQMTVEAWVKPNALNSGVNQAIAAKASALFFKLLGNEIRFTTPAIMDHDSTGAGLVVGAWAHVGVTFLESTSGGCKYYRNGVNFDSDTASAMNGNTNPFQIGYNGTGEYFNGMIDELRVSSVVRSPDWMLASYKTAGDNSAFQTYAGAQSVAPGMPGIVIGSATNITASSAWLCGNLVSTGASATAAIAYWGTTDGGTNVANWANSAALAAPQSEGAFSLQATGLSADSTYYFRVAASNDAGVAWSYYGGNFITGELTLTNTSNAVEATLTPGVFTVTRPGTATNEALSVAYAQSGGTAVSGVDYAPLSGTVTIPAGDASAAITVTPLKNYALMADTTLELSLTGAQAIIGAASNATMTIVNEGMPAAPTNVWVRSGTDPLASTAANWSLGHAPTNQNAIVLLGPYASAPDMTWDLTNAVASWTQTAPYGGTVTIQTKYPGQGAFTNLVVSGNVVLDGGTWTHAPNPSGNTEVNRLYVRVGGDFTLGTNAFVNVDGKGFAAGNYGPGRGNGGGYSGCGASHGGWDAERQSLGPYGNVIAPVNLGSSGNNFPGGGAVLLEVAGNTTLNGSISAIGFLVATSSEYNAGAGGSILLRAGTLDGSGSLNARGGRAYYGGSAGGGRIAMIVADGESFGNVRATAFGGVNGPGNYVNHEGSAGTVYQEHAGHQPGKGVLTIAAQHSVTRYDMPNWPITEMPKASAWNPAVNLDDFSRIVITNGATLGIAADTVMTSWDSARFQVSGPENSYVAVRGTNGLTFPSALTVTNYTLHLDVPVKASGDWRIAANGSLGHSHKGKLDLSLDGNLTVDVGGTISAHRRGYDGGGPGDMGANYSNGASHGGRGGGGYPDFSATYGSVLGPTNWGSRKNTRGGGAVKLDVSGALTVNGSVDADGDRLFPNGGYYGAGSGGSVWLMAGTFAGSGKVSANGGNGGVGPGVADASRSWSGLARAWAPWSAKPRAATAARAGTRRPARSTGSPLPSRKARAS